MTSAVGSGLAAAFGAAARLRRGRPLHPAGRLFEAELRLHGTSRHWGAPFLDQRMELHGLARLSRAAGLPPPLPDILGLALRWHQEGADAELLLATTGHTPLGRRLLRPATAWAPGLYGSLFPYAVAGRRVWLAALPQADRPLPARFGPLTRAAEAAPLLFDLLVAGRTGPWHIFGQVGLVAPAMRDAELPTRFDPTRHPIPGLRPAGWGQRVRGAAYAAAQRTPERAAAKAGIIR
ncbi:hypothetical protein HII36_39050 [Nonomuraea sp. NN258]|uniref:hypothetical protein n=1 Tax=Nonomuraea antri TaxID=2730852 RepID=UPI00156A1A2C|nr:hypothetical protein [Nonomuraea antri]NRQ37786.1 hypothetical protein [Nonomuraea antri]